MSLKSGATLSMLVSLPMRKYLLILVTLEQFPIPLYLRYNHRHT